MTRQAKTAPASEAPLPAGHDRVPQVRIVFMGTPRFAGRILEDLLTDGYNVVAVYTRPDRPTGRDQAVAASPVKEVATAHALPVEQPERFDEETLSRLHQWRPDLVIVAAYGRILPEAVLRLPGFGCLNVHASLLPRWRGASPVQNAILAGDRESGVTLMQIDAGLDTGPLLARRAVPLAATETAESLLERLSSTGSELLRETLPRFVARELEPVPQNEAEATLCQIIERADGQVFWNEEAEAIERKARAFTPWPGIFCFFEQDGIRKRLKLLSVACQKVQPETKRRLGEVFELGERVGVQCATGVLFLERVQPEGKTPMDIREFLRGYPAFLGSVLS